MSRDDKKKLGKILVRHKLVTTDELDDILKDGHPGRLASKVLGKGYAEEVQLLKALSEQMGVPGIDLRRIIVNLNILEYVPGEIAKQNSILPLIEEEEQLFVAMADPEDRRVVEELEFVTGKKVFPYVAIHKLLTEVIGECYRLRDSGKEIYKGILAEDEDEEGVDVSFKSSSVAVLEPSDRRGSAAIVDDRFKETVAGSVPFKDAETDFSGLMPDEEPPAGPPGKKPPPPPEGRSGIMIEQAAMESEKAASSAPEGAGRRKKKSTKKILVVDDDDEIRLLISRVLREKGYEVFDASKGNEALQKVRIDNLNMIILDAMLPEVHGFDICRKIKKSSKYGHIPVIMISAIYRGWRYAQDLKESYGVDAFIEKPFKIGELVEMVEGFFLADSAPPERKGTEELSDEAEQELKKGIQLYKRGDIEGAIKRMEHGIKIDPLAFRLQYHLALLYGKKGNDYKAIQCLESTLELAPDFFPAMKNLAVIYQKTGFKYKAIEIWERALGITVDEETRKGIKEHLMTLL